MNRIHVVNCDKLNFINLCVNVWDTSFIIIMKMINTHSYIRIIANNLKYWNKEEKLF